MNDLVLEYEVGMIPYVIAAVPATMINVIWKDVAPHLQRVVEVANDEITLESVKERLLSADALLVCICRLDEIVACNVVEVRTFDSGIKALYIPIVGGDEMDNWYKQFLEVCKALAKDLGCRELRGIAARKGWIRKLAPEGWTEVCTNVRYMLEN